MLENEERSLSLTSVFITPTQALWAMMAAAAAVPLASRANEAQPDAR